MGCLLYLQLLLAIVVPAIAEIEMKFIKYPESVIAPVGDTVTFECAVNVPGERLVWRWKPFEGPEDDWKDIKETKNNESPEVSAKLVVEIKEDTQKALYQCVVWYGSVSLVSVPARLTIAKVDLSKNTPEKRVITAPVHNTIVLHCKEPQSDPPAVLTWWKDDGKKSKKVLETPHGVLVIHNASLADSGTYGCKATNEISGQTLDLPERTHLKIQHEGNGGVRFLETEDYVGTKDIENENTLTVSVKQGGTLRLWCGVVGTPPPRVSWSRAGEGHPGPALPRRHDHALVVPSFTVNDEGIYSCSANGIRRSWKVVALQPPQWDGSTSNANASEGDKAHVSCGTSSGQPPPTVHWVLNAEFLKPGKGIKANNSDLTIERAEKRHAGIVQCFACNSLACVYDAAILTVVPLQISDQEYSFEVPKTLQISSQPKRHSNRKNPKKQKAVMVPPSRPNVTRLSDDKVMVTWSNANHGLTIQFFKVQYREVTNTSNVQWNTANQDIPAHIHSYEIDGLIPDKYYKFRIAAVYSNQDNNLGRSSAKFYLQSARKGNFSAPLAPVLAQAVANSPHSIQLNWTWSKGNGIEAEGFYVYYRAVSSAGAYEKVLVPGGAAARTTQLQHLAADTPYELKLVAFSTQSPSEFSSIKVAKTLPSPSGSSGGASSPAPGAGAGTGSGAGTGTGAGAGAGAGAGGAPDALVTAGGAVGAAALLVILAVTLLLCRRAKRPPADKEKGSGPESGGANGYIPAKVPITITANPMHSEGADAGVEMSFLHNNNTGNNDDTLPHSRKNGPARQYV